MGVFDILKLTPYGAHPRRKETSTIRAEESFKDLKCTGGQLEDYLFWPYLRQNMSPNITGEAGTFLGLNPLLQSQAIVHDDVPDGFSATHSLIHYLNTLAHDDIHTLQHALTTDISNGTFNKIAALSTA